MPNGFGLYHAGRSLTAEQAALERLGPVAPGPGLVSAAITAIEQLATSSGHPLSAASLAAAAQAGANPGGGSGSRLGSTTSLVVYGAGLVLIALAWGASLRARPPSIGRQRTPT